MIRARPESRFQVQFCVPVDSSTSTATNEPSCAARSRPSPALRAVRKPARKASPTPVVLVGEDYWNSVINFNAMIDSGLIEAADLKIFEIVNTGAEAWAALKAHRVVDAIYRSAADDGAAVRLS